MVEKIVVNANDWTYYRALKVIPKEKKVDICRHYLLSAKKEAHAAGPVIEKIAKFNNFRVQTLQKFSLEKLAAHMAPVLEKFSIDVVDRALVQYHIDNFGPLMKDFLDDLGIPNQDGVLSSDQFEEPPLEALQRTTAMIDGKYGAEDITAYFATLLANNKKFSRLAPILEKRLQSGKAAGNKEGDNTQKIQELSEGVTTLDEVLIKCVVNTAQEIEGSLSEDNLFDLVDEIIRLNSERHSSYFHKGFFEAVFDKKYDFSFKSQNLSRKAWYLTGIILGLLRKGDNKRIIEVCSVNKDTLRAICESDSHDVCFRKIAPHLFDIYIERNMVAEAINLIQTRLPLMSPAFVSHALETAADYIRESKTAEAMLLLNVLKKNLPDIVRAYGELPDSFNLRFKRKQGQALQLSGDFPLAKVILGSLVSEKGLLDMRAKADILSDLGLIEGGFKSISQVRFADSNAKEAFKAGLERGRSYYEQAINSWDGAANASYCMGILEYLSGKHDEAAAHLERALIGMLREEEAYADAGILDVTRFALAAAIFESLDESRFKYAEENLRRSLEGNIRFPRHVCERLIEPTFNYDTSLTAAIGEYILHHYGSNALGMLIIPQVLGKSEEIERAVYEFCDGDAAPSGEKWRYAEALLKAYLYVGAPDKAADMLDKLESIAMHHGNFREKFLTLLENQRNYEPAWDEESARHAKVSVLEVAGKLEEAAYLLTQDFYHLCSHEEDEFSISQAETIIECINGYGIGDDIVDPLRKRMDGVRKTCVLTGNISYDRPFSFLFIGGDERQERQDADIVKAISEKFGHLRVDFYHTNWKSSWGKQIERIKSMIPQYHAVIIMRFVRTELGRRLRKLCGEHGIIWFPCTGHGSQFIENSIAKAYVFLANRKEE